VARRRRPPPLSIRLPPEERAELEARADRAGLSVSGYFRSAVLDTPRPRVTRRPSADRQELARLLGEAGRIGSNINQLAHQANLGSWPDSRLLAEACADIRSIRDMLIRALGVTPPGPTATAGP
jgi:hypothetical protein